MSDFNARTRCFPSGGLTTGWEWAACYAARVPTAELRYVVLGAGAVGGTAAALLGRAGHTVCAVARGPHRQAIAASGLRLRTPDAEHRVQLEVVSPDRLVIDRERDVILLAVKSQDTQAALEQIVRAGGDGATIVCAQNGVANEVQVARVTDRVGAAMVWTPASHLSPGVVECYARPCPAFWMLGAWPGGNLQQLEVLAGHLEQAGLAVQLSDDVMRFKYGKLLANLGNSVDALFDTGPEEPGEEWRAVLDALRAEGEECLSAAGIEWATREELDAALAGRVELAAIGDARREGGSTWQSLARGGTGIELDYLNGEICALGKRCGVATPANRAVLRVAAEVVRDNRIPRCATLADLERARAAVLEQAQGER